MAARNSRLTPERLRSLFHYNPDTGDFTRLVDVRGGSKAGDIAGSNDGGGYLRIGIDGFNYRCHVLAWLYMTGRHPEHVVDHRNQIRSDNRWANLRHATRQQNHCNSKAYAGNTSGFRGVYYAKDRKRQWVARIKVKYRTIHLGSHPTAIEAARAYDAAAVNLHGEFAHLNFPLMTRT